MVCERDREGASPSVEGRPPNSPSIVAFRYSAIERGQTFVSERGSE
jgi:hypothetical protein